MDTGVGKSMLLHELTQTRILPFEIGNATALILRWGRIAV